MQRTPLNESEPEKSKPEPVVADTSPQRTYRLTSDQHQRLGAHLKEQGDEELAKLFLGLAKMSRADEPE